MKKFTLTIGIPAFNEEENIENMIHSITKQHGENFILKRIIVALDGCTDRTFEIVKQLAKKDKRLLVLNGKERYGKTTRLNQIHQMAETELVGTFDADIVLVRECEIDLMVEKFKSLKELNVVAANQIPLISNTICGMASWASFNLFYEAAKKWKNSNNIHLLQGSASIMRTSFAKSFKYPKSTTSDQGYLYMKATMKNKKGFFFAKKTQIYFRSVSTLADWISLGERTLINDKSCMERDFGKEVISEYALPKGLVFYSIIKLFIQKPLETILAVILNTYIRSRHTQRHQAVSGAWEMLSSSKHSINI